MSVTVNRTMAEALNISVGQVFQTLATYVGSSFVGQINKFGLTFQVYAQAECIFTADPGGHRGAAGARRQWHDGAAGHGGDDHADHRSGPGAAV